MLLRAWRDCCASAILSPSDAMSTEARIVMTTAPTREKAERLARHLVEERLAACVNLVPGMHSIYRWQQAVESAEEVLLLIKTSADRLAALESTLHALHSYDVPEFLVLTADAGSEAYLSWLIAAVH